MSLAIGIDLGGTFVKFGIVNRDGEILKEGILPTFSESSSQRVPEKVKACIDELFEYTQTHDWKIDGIGLGVPGVVEGGTIIGCENLRELDGFPIQSFIESYYSLPVVVDNDANLMGLAEVHFAKDNPVKDMVFLTIGTGIGGALYLNGNLYGGYRNRGTELGHMSIDFRGTPCNCGSRGCLETLASVPALIAHYKSLWKSNPHKIPNPVDGKYIIGRYLSGEMEAITALNQHFDFLSAGISGLINIFGPQKVILGGGITDSGEFYVEEIRKRAYSNAMRETSEFTVIERARLGNKAGLMGAAAQIFLHKPNHD
jgi:glucokinase